MSFLVISSHLYPQDIEVLDGDMVIIGDDLRQTEMVLYVSSSLEDAKQFCEECSFSPQTTILESINGQLQWVAHLEYNRDSGL